MGLKSLGNPGKLDQVLTLQSPTKAQNATTREKVTSYATAGTVRAARVAKSSTERFEVQQQVGVTIDEFIVRDWRSLYAITHEWRFLYRGNTYNVRGIQEGGRKNFLVITGERKD